MVSVAAVRDQLLALGVLPGTTLLVHTSFRAVRPIEGGPKGLLEALRLAIGLDGTLVMPTMTDGESVFDPRSTPTVDMGIVAETFWRTPGVLRSTHPGGSFAAEGPNAEMICAPQPLSPPHGPDSPPGRVHALGGHVLLLGVTQSESTMLHVAEAMAGVPYSIEYPTVVEQDGRAETVLIAETDHCCAGFRKVEPLLRERGALAEGPVGHGHARLSPAQALVDVAREHLAADPLFFLCAREAGCEECDRARASVRAA